MTGPKKHFGFLLQQQSRPFYQGFNQALTDAVNASPIVRGTCCTVFVDDLEPAAVGRQIERLGQTVDAIAVVAANHPRIAAAIDRLGEDGIPVFALISELTATSPTAYVGLDNWKVCRTAGWAVANICKRPGKVGIFTGSPRYRCQDLNEMGFRSHFREHAPEFTVLEALTSLEDSRYAAEMTRELLARNPDLVGLYVAGGGVRGVMSALREDDAFRRIVAVGHELTPKTREGLIDGVLKLAIAHPVAALTQTMVAAMAAATEFDGKDVAPRHLLPFDLTAENL